MAKPTNGPAPKFTRVYTFNTMTKNYGKYSSAGVPDYYVDLAAMTSPPRKELTLVGTFSEEVA